MLLNKETIEKILEGDIYAPSHHARDGFLGGGMLYYALAYMVKAELCVCLGSGTGFVPKVMRQAQLDAGIDGKTILIDADLPEAGWGSPDYFKDETPFTKNFSDVVRIKELSVAASSRFESNSIDYLHIDADHSYEGVKADFEAYRSKIKHRGYMTLHDSIHRDCGVYKLIAELRKMANIDVVNLSIGTGVALVKVSQV